LRRAQGGFKVRCQKHSKPDPAARVRPPLPDGHRFPRTVSFEERREFGSDFTRDEPSHQLAVCGSHLDRIGVERVLWVGDKPQSAARGEAVALNFTMAVLDPRDATGPHTVAEVIKVLIPGNLVDELSVLIEWLDAGAVYRLAIVINERELIGGPSDLRHLPRTRLASPTSE